jgi:hypothetical protein
MREAKALGLTGDGLLVIRALGEKRPASADAILAAVSE